MSIIEIILLYLAAINMFTLLVYGWDKIKAKRGGWRIPEATLLMLAVVGGSIGATLAMEWFHHKTRHRKFTIGIPIIIMLQVVLIGYLAYSIGD